MMVLVCGWERRRGEEGASQLCLDLPAELEVVGGDFTRRGCVCMHSELHAMRAAVLDGAVRNVVIEPIANLAGGAQQRSRVAVRLELQGPNQRAHGGHN